MYRKKKLPSIYVWIAILFVMCVWCVVLLWWFFANDSYRIRHVRYTTTDIQHYPNIDMYTMISASLTGESLRYRSIIWYNAIAEDIYRRLPYIAHLAFTPQWPSTIHVDITFREPPLIMHYMTGTWAVYSWWYTIPLFSGNTLGRDAKLLRLPVYLTGLSHLSGIFFDVWFDKIYHDRVLLDPLIATWWFVTYIPGGEKYILVNGPYRYYFNAKKDIQNQIDMLLYFKNNYAWFASVTQVDLWSLNYPIVL